jgi:hypothetical protein
MPVVGIGMGIVSSLGLAGQFASGIMSAKARQGEFAETVRRIGRERDITVGSAIAKVGASGIEMDSASTVNYLKALTDEFNREIKNVQKTAKATKTADMIGNLAGIFGGGAQTYSALGQANNWKF